MKLFDERGRLQVLQEVINAVIDSGADANKSASPVVGQQYFATDTNIFYVCFLTGIWSQLVKIKNLVSGTDAAKPETPAVGDVYIATDTSTMYVCYVAEAWVGVGGAVTWLSLTDTPANFDGEATKFPKVNAGETALEFADGAHLITLLEALSAQPWVQQCNNILKNGDFWRWENGAAAAPDGWTLSAAGGESVARQATTVRLGEYSAAVTRVNNDCWIYQIPIIPIDGNTNVYWRGKKLTLGCWVYATVASRAYIIIDDGVEAANSEHHSGVAGWELLTVTKTIHANATQVRVRLNIHNGNTTAYFDGAILTEGTIVPTFAPKCLENSGDVLVEVDETKMSHKIPIRIDGDDYYVMLTQT